MAALSVVVLEPGRKGGAALGVGLEGLPVGPLDQQGWSERVKGDDARHNEGEEPRNRGEDDTA